MILDKTKKQLENEMIHYINQLDIDKDKHIQLIYNFEDNDWYKEITNEWYKSLEINEPKYDIYNTSFFLLAGFDCYIKYSRKYVNMLYKNEISNEILSSCSTIVDVGNGTGHSTQAFKECFMNSKVYGTNVIDSYQYNHNLFLQNEMIVLDNQQIDCFVFFEFMEHIHKPIEYINDIIKTHQPKVLVFANSFNTRCIGHFIDYENDGEIINQKDISRRFNKNLKMLGYKQVKCNFWNNRPSLWINYGSTY
jgi:hypothetical protein